MTVNYLGSVSVGASIPGAMSAIAAALPHLEAQVAALASFAPVVTLPTFDATLVLATQTLANVTLAMSAGISPPTLTAQLDLVATIIADLQAQLSVILDFQNLAATGGVHLYHYNGAVNALGNEFQAQLSGGFPGGAGADTCNALLLGTTAGATWTAMQGAFKTS